MKQYMVNLLLFIHTDISAINPRFSSPMRLDGVDCSPFDIFIPKCEEEQASGSLSHCCRELFDKDSWPEQTITSPENYVILFFMSLVLFVVRLALWKYVYVPNKGRSMVEKSDARFWILCLWDQYVTLFVAAVFAGLVTNYSKLLVGAPRPLYFAFQIYASIHVDHREELDFTSETSFISGHASSAATVLGFNTILLLVDLQYFRDHQPQVAFCVTQLAIIPMTVSYITSVYLIFLLFRFL